MVKPRNSFLTYAFTASISSSLGLALFASKAVALMIWPAWQYPHCGTSMSCHARVVGRGLLMSQRANDTTRHALRRHFHVDAESKRAGESIAQRFERRQRESRAIVQALNAVATPGSADGFELHFGTNHVGHYLFTRLLMPLVEKGATALVLLQAARILPLSLAPLYSVQLVQPLQVTHSICSTAR